MFRLVAGIIALSALSVGASENRQLAERQVAEAEEALRANDRQTAAARLGAAAANYVAVNDVKSASDLLQRAIRLDGRNEWLFQQLGMFYLKFRAPEPAAIVFRLGTARFPGSAQMWLGIAMAEHLQEHPEVAETAVRKAIALNNKVPDAYLVLANILERDRPREALEVLREAVRRFPGNGAALLNYGNLALTLDPGAAPAVIPVLERAVALRPNTAANHCELARALEAADRRKRAIAEYEAAVRLEPGLAKAHYRLSVLYRLSGDTDRARAALDAFRRCKSEEERHAAQPTIQYQIQP
ncbi:MAG: tetratricopeptide repeat protein [Acidobacteriaceae bacterium]|nr:tetratricopeptide repeat protein [Acidobacteriaceae bacterium]